MECRHKPFVVLDRILHMIIDHLSGFIGTLCLWCLKSLQAFSRTKNQSLRSHHVPHIKLSGSFVSFKLISPCPWRLAWYECLDLKSLVVFYGVVSNSRSAWGGYARVWLQPPARWMVECLHQWEEPNDAHWWNTLERCLWRASHFLLYLLCYSHRQEWFSYELAVWCRYAFSFSIILTLNFPLLFLH